MKLLSEFSVTLTVYSFQMVPSDKLQGLQLYIWAQIMSNISPFIAVFTNKYSLVCKVQLEQFVCVLLGS